MAPTAWLESAIFSDGTRLDFSENDIVVFVGPNNSGKSAALRDIHSKFAKTKKLGVVVKDLKIKTSGTEEDIVQWLEKTCRKDVTDPTSPVYWQLNAAL